MRNFTAVLTGVMASILVILAGDAITHSLYRPSRIGDTNTSDPYVTNVPFYAMLIMLLIWISASFIGGLISARLNRAAWRRSAALTGTILLVVSVVNMVLIPHPLWMWAVSVILLIPAAVTGGRLAAGAQK
jgi:hypothetical protein